MNVIKYSFVLSLFSRITMLFLRWCNSVYWGKNNNNSHFYWAVQWSWFARVNALCNLLRKKSQEVAASLPGQFLSRRCFTLCITMEVEPRIAKQYKCHHCWQTYTTTVKWEWEKDRRRQDQHYNSVSGMRMRDRLHKTRSALLQCVRQKYIVPQSNEKGRKTTDDKISTTAMCLADIKHNSTTHISPRMRKGERPQATRSAMQCGPFLSTSAKETYHVSTMPKRPKRNIPCTQWLGLRVEQCAVPDPEYPPSWSAETRATATFWTTDNVS